MAIDADVHAISAVSGNNKFDEAPFIRMMAGYLNCPAHEVKLDRSPEQWFSLLDEVVNGRQQVHGLQIGVVVKLENDPDGEFRILVKVPVIDNNADGLWTRVASLDAGSNRGAFFMPEIGDEVIGYSDNRNTHAELVVVPAEHFCAVVVGPCADVGSGPQ